MTNTLKSKEAFLKTPYFSTKHESYFKVYDQVVNKIKCRSDQPPTIVEIGILHGGSLFMWRDLFGADARIIGVDLNPAALKWRENGFEIYIGNQSSPAFWKEFYDEVGAIDFLVDDGGHTNRQQIVTVVNAIDNVKPGGIILIEDTDTSFIKEFGNPSRYSFLNFSKKIVDVLYEKQATGLESSNFGRNIESVMFLDSIVIFEIKDDSSIQSKSIDNGGIRDSASDFRHQDLGRFARQVSLLVQWSSRKVDIVSMETRGYVLSKAAFCTVNRIATEIYRSYVLARLKIENTQLKKHFRK